MMNLSGRVERLEKKVSAADETLLVLDLPYGDGTGMEAERRRILEERGLTPSDLERTTVVFVTRYGS